jgi:septum formation topological specificity factor MinE
MSGCKSSMNVCKWEQVIDDLVQVIQEWVQVDPSHPGAVQVINDMVQVIQEWVQVGARHLGVGASYTGIGGCHRRLGASGCKSPWNGNKWMHVIQYRA